MNLSLIVIADYANVTQDGKLNVLGIFDVINSGSFPARHPGMFLVIRLSPELGELDQDKTLDIRFVDSDNHELIAFGVPVRIQKDGNGNRSGTNVLVQLNDTVIPGVGTYNFVAEMDGDILGQVSVSANQL